MPAYNYECLLCLNRFEQKHEVKDCDQAKCPECGGPTRIVIPSIPHYWASGTPS